MAIPQERNLLWSLDLIETLVSSRRFRILTLIDDITREGLRMVTPAGPAPRTVASPTHDGCEVHCTTTIAPRTVPTHSTHEKGALNSDGSSDC
jgi:hypothetical protein